MQLGVLQSLFIITFPRRRQRQTVGLLCCRLSRWRRPSFWKTKCYQKSNNKLVLFIVLYDIKIQSLNR